MNDQMLDAIAEFELEEDMRRAEERAEARGFMERDSDGRLILTPEGEKHFWEWFHSSELTLH